MTFREQSGKSHFRTSLRDDGDAVNQIDAPDDVDLPLIEKLTIEDHSLPIDIFLDDEDNFPVENARELAETVLNGDVHVR